MAVDVYSLIAERFGARTEVFELPVALDADTTAKQLLRQDPRRLAFTLVNLSANIVFIAPDPAVSSTRGIRLTAGSSVSLGFPDDLHMAALEWFVAADVDNSAIYCIGVRFADETGA